MYILKFKLNFLMHVIANLNNTVFREYFCLGMPKILVIKSRFYRPLFELNICPSVFDWFLLCICDHRPTQPVITLHWLFFVQNSSAYFCVYSIFMLYSKSWKILLTFHIVFTYTNEQDDSVYFFSGIMQIFLLLKVLVLRHFSMLSAKKKEMPIWLNNL